MKNNTSKFLKTLGPGMLFASTAIGVSHLVQSTRAGAMFGFGLVGVILLTNLLKFPFFEYGSRYASVTGTSLIDGYKKIGSWVLISYFIITLGSMFFVTAAVGTVTAGFFENLFHLSSFFALKKVGIVLVFLLSTLILMFGRFNLLDNLIKIIGFVLVISTLTAFVIVLFMGPTSSTPPSVDVFSNASVPFIIALMGWMPTAVDLSTWNSLWTLEKIKSSGYKPTLKETLFEFKFGYILSAVLSLVFVTLGAYLIFGTGIKMSSNSAKFAHQIIELYTQTIGSWSNIIIASAGFSIMFGTSLGVFDGYARSLERIMEILLNKGAVTEDKKNYQLAIIVTALGGFSIVWFFPSNIKELVDLATTISFLIAPFVAGVNFYLVMNKDFDTYGKPSISMQVLSWIGLTFLTGFSLYFLWFKFIV